MYEKWNEALTKCLLFKGIGAEELGSMLDCMSPRVMSSKRNSPVVTEGDNMAGLGIVLEGEAAVVKENSAGSRVILSLLKPGDMFGEMAVFSGDGRWPATIISQKAGRVMFLPAGSILGQCGKLCPSHRRLVLNMLEVVSRKALMLNRKLDYLTTRSMRGRIARYLLEQSAREGSLAFRLPLKRGELADFLNVSRPSLSREMGRMRDEGIMTFDGSSIRILDIARLRASKDLP